jgi:hypothetical protein
MTEQDQFIEAFNNGYILAKYEPKMLNTLTKNLATKTEYLEGFFAGKEEYELDRQKSVLNELDDLRTRSSSNFKER